MKLYETLSNDDIKKIIEIFPNESNNAIAKNFNTSTFQIDKIRKEYKLKKSETYKRNIPSKETHYKWKGGKTWERFCDPKYIQWRKSVLERDNYICQHCFKKCKKNEKGLAAHHIKEWAKFIENRFEIENGICLCRRCHMTLHGRPIPEDTFIECACGCGTLIKKQIKKKDGSLIRKYVNHHGKKGKKLNENSKKLIKESHKGKILSIKHKSNISTGLKSSSKKIGRKQRHWNNFFLSEEDFKLLFPITKNSELSKICNLHENTIIKFARLFKLKKGSKKATK